MSRVVVRAGITLVLAFAACTCGEPPLRAGDGGTACHDTSKDPENCGACGVACPTGVCRRAHCDCATASDCPAGDACKPGGACVAASDPCATLACPAEEVCRGGACRVAACRHDGDCAPGESCDATGICRVAGDPCVAVRCPPSTSCRDGVCAVDACAADADCLPAERCAGGFCREGATATCVGEGVIPCGAQGSSCVQSCDVDGGFTECEPPTGPVDLRGDPANCGYCGEACPAPPNARAACVDGVCATGPCAAGFFDFDAAPGCETSCVGLTCTLGDGGTVVLTEPPLPQTGSAFDAFASGSSLGADVETGPRHTNFAVLGEPTPAPAGAAVQTSARHTNVGGLRAATK